MKHHCGTESFRGLIEVRTLSYPEQVIDVCFKMSIKPSKFSSAKGFWTWTFLKLCPQKVTGKVENELGRESVELHPFAISTKTYI